MSTRTLLIVSSAVLLSASVASAQRADMRFSGMDRNGDGVITRAEWRGSAQSFRVHDWNGDGVLSGDEVNPNARPPSREVERPPTRNTPFNDWTDARFREFDHNRDGVLTRDEWHYDADSFARADSNRDGRVTRDEFLRTNSNDNNREGRFADLDYNRDGRIDRNEWRGGARAFDDLDRNRDGVLTRDEFADNTPDDRENRFADLDLNRDGRIDRNEWRGGARAFDDLDRNRDGVLTRDEMLSRGASPAADLFATLDVNRDRRITQNEWRGTLANFRRHDTNGDGVLTRAELNRQPVGTSGATARLETPAYRAGYARGLAEGRTAGHGDKVNGHGWDLEGQTELEHANSGYTPDVGLLNEYQDGYRAGFRAGYREGFGPQ